MKGHEPFPRVPYCWSEKALFYSMGVSKYPGGDRMKRDYRHICHSSWGDMLMSVDLNLDGAY